MSKKVLLIGSSGMLGQAIAKEIKAHANYRLYTAGRKLDDYHINILDDDELKKVFEDVRPDIVINCAAQTNVNDCKNHPGDTYLINTRLPGVLTELCRINHSYLVHISTDHFFVGDGDQKHTEDDEVSIVNEYARTKYLAEKLVLTYEKAVVLRTNVVGMRGSKKQTLLEWIADSVVEGTKLELYNDFFTSSMHCIDFARILMDIMEKQLVGVYNMACSDVTSKEVFIRSIANDVFHKEIKYKIISVKEIDGVQRAESLGLDNSKLEAELGYKMPSFRDTLDTIKRDFEERKII